MKQWIYLMPLLILTSCATQQEKKQVEQKVANETTVVDGTTLSISVQETIAASKTLSPEQKEQLQSLFLATRTKARSLLEDSYKLRSVLIKELLASNVNPSEIKILKKNIKKVESERMKLTLSAADQITKIVGQNKEKEQFAEHLMLIERLH